MSDGYKYIELFYKLEPLESFNVELEITSITGIVKYSTLFYLDEQHTQFLGESAIQNVVLGPNLFQTGSSQSGNIPLYVIGRIKVLQGSTLGLGSLKINGLSHIEEGSLSIDIPPLTFTQSIVNQTVYQSVKLGLILDPTFQIDLQVQAMAGALEIQYLYYTDANYTLLSSTQTAIVDLDTAFRVNTVNNYVLLRFKLPAGGNLNINSFKIQEVEQGTYTVTTPTYVPEVAVVSETCFPSGTLVQTDQGYLEIQDIVPHYHTIRGKNVIAITSTYSSDKVLVSIKKDSLRRNYPTSDTLVSRKHKIYLNGKMQTAYSIVGKNKGATLVPYEGNVLFNVLLEDYGNMNVHGMICETLHPSNPLASIFSQLYPNKIETIIPMEQ